MTRLPAPAPRRPDGFTLVELLVTVSIAGVLLMLAAPSVTEWILVQRVRASAAEMVTDIQYARGEAVRRGVNVAITFQNVATQTCYTVHTTNLFNACRCSLPTGTACGGANAGNRFELKTVNVIKTSKITVVSDRASLVFDAIRGLPTGMNTMQVDVSGGANRKLRVLTNATGRPQVCAPEGSTIVGHPACA
ncbi:GspH/FimT family pseudopilin [Ideonella sp. A 288]|uniref:GspH/FimT family pseudopilin n=1 Tax=Ideonella sp. A 288 TaxID=1962181 RepID=UPI000B4B8EF4|nr:GspH/FimT family pseudopilin [Ideonella sp. A 288]